MNGFESTLAQFESGNYPSLYIQLLNFYLENLNI